MTDTTYNGWKNYETWNVALWLGNDEFLYSVARRCWCYRDLVLTLLDLDITETPDGVNYNDFEIDEECLDEMLSDDF